MVKWGGLIALSQGANITTIVQVAYYRQAELPKLKFDGKSLAFPEQVRNHFRNIENITQLGKTTGIGIEVFKKPFTHDSRVDYHKILLRKIKAIKKQKIVFLDPDNGLAPGNCKDEHVKSEEVTDVWQVLSSGDYLVFYQHLFRKADWAEINRKKLAEACSIKLNQVHTWSSELAHDVVFFYIGK